MVVLESRVSIFELSYSAFTRRLTSQCFRIVSITYFDPVPPPQGADLSVGLSVCLGRTRVAITPMCSCPGSELFSLSLDSGHHCLPGSRRHAKDLRSPSSCERLGIPLCFIVKSSTFQNTSDLFCFVIWLPGFWAAGESVSPWLSMPSKSVLSLTFCLVPALQGLLCCTWQRTGGLGRDFISPPAPLSLLLSQLWIW